MALHYLCAFKRKALSKKSQEDLTEGNQQDKDLIQDALEEDTFKDEDNSSKFLNKEDQDKSDVHASKAFCDHPLERCYDALCDNTSFKVFKSLLNLDLTFSMILLICESICYQSFLL